MPTGSLSMKADPQRSPRNHWWHLEQVFKELEEGRVISAWKILTTIRHSTLIPPQAISDAFELISRSWGEAHISLDRPSDFLRRTPGNRSGLPVLRGLVNRTEVPTTYPYDMVLPPLTGNANDFSFISDVLGRSEFTGPSPTMRLRLVVQLAGEEEIQFLENQVQAYIKRGGGGEDLSLAIFGPDDLKYRRLPIRATWHHGKPWSLQKNEQLQYLTEDTDVLLFLPLCSLVDPFLFERVKRSMAMSKSLCIVLQEMTASNLVDVTDTVMNEAAVQKSWRRKPTSFRSLIRLAFSVNVEKFREVGGFDSRFIDESYACRQIGFKLYNKGSYFIPLSVRVTQPFPKKSAKNLADEILLTATCPHPWDRKADGRFEVPKVSVYIPAYKAVRYLREAIESVLEQDFQDLEVCVADDGSPDETRKVLESYSDEPRVRWETGLNGGIGHASNRAIRMSRGLYVGQLDSDDRLKPGAIRRLASYLDQHHEVGCVYSSCERIGPTGAYLKNEYSWEHYSREKMMLTSIAHHFRMFRRQVWERTEGFREDIVNGVDYDMFLKMSEVSDFHHINEVLYQRRWHGENTSSVNEVFQTTNTHRVQRETLKRLGLEQYWDVHVPDSTKPRQITFKRIGSQRRVFFWPDYSQSNPYQRLLYSEVQKNCEVLGGSIATALRAIRETKPEDNAQVTFHLHWLNKIIRDSKNLGEAFDKATTFLDEVRQFKACGGRLVWTIHNTMSHEVAFPQVEKIVTREIMSMADAIHVHCLDSVKEIEEYFDVPAEKVFAYRHGAYCNIYPDFVSRVDARQELGLGMDDEVILFLGQMRSYKGVDALLSSFQKIAPHRPRLQLVLAGSGPIEGVLSSVDPTLRGRIHVFNRYIDNAEIQLFMRSADIAALPYTNILTSGSLLLALSFGLPVVAPSYGMIRAVLDGDEQGRSDSGVYYSPERSVDGLADALQQLLHRLDSGEGPAMSSAARARAETQTWEDITPMLFGDPT